MTPQATILDQFLDEIAYFEGILVDIVPAANHPTPPSPRINATRCESPDLGHLYSDVSNIESRGRGKGMICNKLSHFELGVFYVLSSSQK